MKSPRCTTFSTTLLAGPAGMTCSVWLRQGGVLLTGTVGKGTTAQLQAFLSAGLADEREEAVAEEVWGVKTQGLD